MASKNRNHKNQNRNQNQKQSGNNQNQNMNSNNKQVEEALQVEEVVTKEDKKPESKKAEGTTSLTETLQPYVERFVEFVVKYKRYLTAGALFLIMVIILARCAAPEVVGKKDTPEVQYAADGSVIRDIASEEFEIDQYPEINTLITNYYQAYAAGDVESLGQMAIPLSDTEKSYIEIFSQYVSGYNNLKCYTKKGLNEGDYLVSVYLEMGFEGVATAAPGLDFFYLKSNGEGKLFIDNAYSQFNQSNMQSATQPDIQALISEFEVAEDVVALQKDVQTRYESAVASDVTLQSMVNETIPAAITMWIEQISAGTATDVEDGAEADAGNEAQAVDGEQDAEVSEENMEAVEMYATSVMNLRSGPSTADDILAVIELGKKVKMYPDTEKDGWVKVDVYKKSGYVMKQYLSAEKEAEEESTAPTTTDAAPEGETILLTDSVNIRKSMSTDADRVGLAYAGETVKVIQSYQEGWTKVEWKNKTGYIKTDILLEQ